MANGNNPNPKKTSTTSTPKAKKTATTKTSTAGTKKRTSTTTATTTKKSKPKAEPEATQPAPEAVDNLPNNNEPIALKLFAPYGGLKKIGGQFAFEVLPGEDPQKFRDATEAITWLQDNITDLNEMLEAEGLAVPEISEGELKALFDQAIFNKIMPSIEAQTVDLVDDNPTPTADTSTADEDEEDEEKDCGSLIDLTDDVDGMTGEERTKAIALMKAPLSSLIFGDVNTETPMGVYNHEYTQKELAEYLGLDLAIPLNALMIAVAKKGHGLQFIGGGKYKITA